MLKSLLNSQALMPIIMGQVRHIVAGSGASLATAGYMTGGQIETFTGAVMFLVGLVLSAVSKKMAA